MPSPKPLRSNGKANRKGADVDADRAEAEVRAHPNQEEVRWSQPDPVKPDGKKGERKANRGRSGQAQKPSLRSTAPQCLRGSQCKRTNAHGHHHEQQRDRTKAQWTSDQRGKADQSERAQREAMQRQEPGIIPSGAPEARSNHSCSRRPPY